MFFSGKILKCSNNYGYAFIHIIALMNELIYILFLSSIEILLLKVALIALSKYERGNGANKTRTISSFESRI